jgi:hypothetical protein
MILQQLLKKYELADEAVRVKKAPRMTVALLLSLELTVVNG